MQHQPPLNNTRTNQDTTPIVFPCPATTHKPDSNPPTLPPDSDLLLDPYANIFCFVCQVSVPKGASNIEQHLNGKKHDTNNKKFTSPAQKLQIRSRYAQAAREQRATLINSIPIPFNPPKPANISPTPMPTPTPTPTVPATATLQAPVVPAPKQPLSKQAAKKALREELSQRFQRASIDKAAFISSLLDDSEAVQRPPGSDSDGDSDQSDDSGRASGASARDEWANRQLPFGPIKLAEREGPDYFFESMAAESEPSQAAVNIRQTLAAVALEGKGEGVERSDGKGGASGGGESALKGFIEMADVSGKGEEGEEIESDSEREAEMKNVITLKDVNGEELPPWLLDTEAAENVLCTNDSSVALHYEVLQFLQFMSPTASEINSRKEMILMVESIVKSVWPESSTHVFGSYATGLSLPTSDIDICVMGTPSGGEMTEFEQLAEAVRNVNGFAKRVNVIKATVPLVKIISRKTSLNCDICIGRDNGPKVVPLIRQYLKDFPAVRPVLMVIKCFLQQRSLNEVYKGGFGSYTIFLLVVSHLQMFRYNFPNSKANLGVVLQTFFQLYGRMFNMCIAGIRVKDNGSYFDKFERYGTAPQDILRFSIEDPNDETNELGKNGYAAMRVRKAFNNASLGLINWRRDDSSGAPTPLGAVLDVGDDLRIRRRSVIEDMESKGLTPLRTSLKGQGSANVTRDGLPVEQEQVGEALRRFQEGRDWTSEEVATRSPLAPARGRHQDPRVNRGSREPYNSRDSQGRDPRLNKRRRTIPGQAAQWDRRHGNAQSGYAGDPTYLGSSTNLHQPRSGGSINGGYRMGGNEVNEPAVFHAAGPSHNGGFPYGAQPNYAEYPPQAIPVATPGYQYTDAQFAQATPNGMGGQMLPNQGYATYPQRRVEYMNGGQDKQYASRSRHDDRPHRRGSRHGRGKRDRGRSVRRGSYRGY